MLPPLDTRIVNALPRVDDDDEELEFDPHNHISMIKELISEDDNWLDGVLRLRDFSRKSIHVSLARSPRARAIPCTSRVGPTTVGSSSM